MRNYVAARVLCSERECRWYSLIACNSQKWLFTFKVTRTLYKLYTAHPPPRHDGGMREHLAVVQWLVQICKQQWDKGCWNVIVVVTARGPEVEPLSTLFLSSDVLWDVSCVFFKFIWRSVITEFFIRVDKTLASYSRGSGFKYRPGDRLSWGFYGFSQSLQANFGVVYQIRPRPLPFASLLIHYSQLLLQSTDNDSVARWTVNKASYSARTDSSAGGLYTYVCITSRLDTVRLICIVANLDDTAGET
jgi:hypothetical protein